MSSRPGATFALWHVSEGWGVAAVFMKGRLQQSVVHMIAYSIPGPQELALGQRGERRGTRDDIVILCKLSWNHYKDNLIDGVNCKIHLSLYWFVLPWRELLEAQKPLGNGLLLKM